MRPTLLLCFLAFGCASAQLPTPAALVQVAPVAVRPVLQVQPAPLTLPDAVIEALLQASQANPAPEVEVQVRGRRYACIRGPLEKLAARELPRDTVWQVYVRDLSEPVGQVINFDKGGTQ